ncbi:MAG: site-2 protease family protein [Cyanobium sp. MAG06]|nr:site-2 protease family protein [Cyanobium sp. MAG06]
MTINEIIIYIGIIFFSVILHEIAHGYVAYLFGDKTAKYAGRLTLNPQSHIDIFGSIILPAICAMLKLPIFGYAKPVPVNPYNIKYKWGMLLVSSAGIITNILLALIGVLLLK